MVILERTNKIYFTGEQAVIVEPDQPTRKANNDEPVSYTHLDVYKRQLHIILPLYMFCFALQMICLLVKLFWFCLIIIVCFFHYFRKSWFVYYFLTAFLVLLC